jgi:hypothetical protein
MANRPAASEIIVILVTVVLLTYIAGLGGIAFYAPAPGWSTRDLIVREGLLYSLSGLVLGFTHYTGRRWLIAGLMAWYAILVGLLLLAVERRLYGLAVLVLPAALALFTGYVGARIRQGFSSARRQE